jgi:hypothetical protein
LDIENFKKKRKDVPTQWTFFEDRSAAFRPYDFDDDPKIFSLKPGFPKVRGRRLKRPV